MGSTPAALPFPSAEMQTIESQLEATKLLLSDAQTEYMHCFARGDFAACGPAKRKVNKYMKAVQFLVAQKLAAR